MKHIYMLCLVLGFGVSVFGQIQIFQIEQVNFEIGTPFSTINLASNESNDAGLNQIFETHNVTYYDKMFPDYTVTSNYENSLVFNIVNCDGCDAQQFLDDLNAYDIVVEYANALGDEFNGIHNALRLELLDETVGVAVGMANGIITTNDALLNQIFTNFNVRHYEYILDEDYYGLICDCDASTLKQELDSYTTLISATYKIGASILLSVKDQTLEETKVYPNPFTNKVTIETHSNFEQILLFDILGKQLYNSKNVEDFERFSSTLKSGVYVLKLVGAGGETVSKKLVKY